MSLTINALIIEGGTVQRQVIDADHTLTDPHEVAEKLQSLALEVAFGGPGIPMEEGEFALSDGQLRLERVIETYDPQKGYEVLERVLHDMQMPEQYYVMPVGNEKYPPEKWYAASLFDLTGSKEQPLGDPRYHPGVDWNLAVPPYGDVERTLGLSVRAITDGVVTFSTPNWGGVPMIVIKHTIDNEEYWFQYAHINPIVEVGDAVLAGETLGPFANYDGGDHLHLGCASHEITTEWKRNAANWKDPVEVLEKVIDPELIAETIRR
jgi:murein DD-endopeptidase MepM/ murein hydrolase activator NlpD